jgi:hypothetical protein
MGGACVYFPNYLAQSVRGYLVRSLNIPDELALQRCLRRFDESLRSRVQPVQTCAGVPLPKMLVPSLV